MVKENKMENQSSKCFVPSCTNKNFKTKQSLQFFRVPDGIEGHFWTKAVKYKQRKYEQMIGLLSGATSVYECQQKSNKKSKSNLEYCCEVHFDIENDIEVIVGDNGSVEYKIKPGVVPSVQPRQARRLWELYEDHGNCTPSVELVEVEENNIKSECLLELGSNTDSFNHTEVINHTPKINYISVVDISTLINKPKYGATQDDFEETNTEDQTFEIKTEPIMPMMPLTIALMKRKSSYYMGLDPSHFSRLLQSTIQSTHLSELKIMLTLRKLRLNEPFETLGDLFDIDKTTTEQCYEESKDFIIEVMDELTNSNNIDMIPESMIKIEPYANLVDLKDPMDFHGTAQPDDDEMSDSSETNYGSEPDPDVELEDLTSPDSSDLEFIPDVDDVGDPYSSDESNEIESPKTNCPICDRPCRRLQNHMNRIHLNPQNINKTICGLCLEKFENKTILRSHQNDIHDGKAYGCDICNRTYGTFPKMRSHIYIKHSELKTHLCHICGEGYPFERLLRLHTQKKHLMIRNHQCHLCDKKYIHRPSLESHIQSIHTNERPFKCPVTGCGKSFSRKSSLNTHHSVHSQVKFYCDMCTKDFSFKCNLRTHRKNVHGQM